MNGDVTGYRIAMTTTSSPICHLTGGIQPEKYPKCKCIQSGNPNKERGRVSKECRSGHIKKRAKEKGRDGSRRAQQDNILHEWRYNSCVKFNVHHH
ncbi:hypothetical protein NPIL_252881 [Nephila pilipes]|uniref:Uncharacterized protein n=1 Tax=Nephila pilipes TaxID=299642 RepID=A0A8X6QR10_NEPPI|nr:hypothetical protein NPIL_252881 [Nephila pilipes]